MNFITKTISVYAQYARLLHFSWFSLSIILAQIPYFNIYYGKWNVFFKHDTRYIKFCFWQVLFLAVLSNLFLIQANKVYCTNPLLLSSLATKTSQSLTNESADWDISGIVTNEEKWLECPHCRLERYCASSYDNGESRGDYRMTLCVYYKMEKACQDFWQQFHQLTNAKLSNTTIQVFLHGFLTELERVHHIFCEWLPEPTSQDVCFSENGANGVANFALLAEVQQKLNRFITKLNSKANVSMSQLPLLLQRNAEETIMYRPVDITEVVVSYKEPTKQQMFPLPIGERDETSSNEEDESMDKEQDLSMKKWTKFGYVADRLPLTKNNVWLINFGPLFVYANQALLPLSSETEYSNWINMKYNGSFQQCKNLKSFVSGKLQEHSELPSSHRAQKAIISNFLNEDRQDSQDLGNLYNIITTIPEEADDTEHQAIILSATPISNFAQMRNVHLVHLSLESAQSRLIDIATKSHNSDLAVPTLLSMLSKNSILKRANDVCQRFVTELMSKLPSVKNTMAMATLYESATKTLQKRLLSARIDMLTLQKEAEQLANSVEIHRCILDNILNGEHVQQFGHAHVFDVLAWTLQIWQVKCLYSCMPLLSNTRSVGQVVAKVLYELAIHPFAVFKDRDYSILVDRAQWVKSDDHVYPQFVQFTLRDQRVGYVLDDFYTIMTDTESKNDMGERWQLFVSNHFPSKDNH